MRLALTQIRTDGGTFARASLTEATITEYAEALQQGCVFPPLVVFLEGATGNYWLADGHHRYHAASRVGYREIEIDLKLGTRRDAILYAVGANATHGLKRSAADKRHAVKMLLEDPEWGEYSDRAIASITKTAHSFVGKIRLEVTGFKSTERLYQNKYGDLGKMNVEQIGRFQGGEEKPKVLKLQPAIWKRLEHLQQQWGEINLEAALARLIDISSPTTQEIKVVPIKGQRTLGIDPALGTLRWAILEAVDDYDIPRLLDYGTISTTLTVFEKWDILEL